METFRLMMWNTRIALALALLLTAAGAADAHALDDLIQCIQQGPYCS